MSSVKMSQYPHFVCYQNTLYSSSISNGSIFFSSSGTHQSHLLFGCHATGISSRLISFLSTLRFSNLVWQDKKAVLTREKI